MKQNLIKSFCPVCKKAKNFLGFWVVVVNKKELPDNLPAECCPSCLLNVVNNDCFQL